MENLASNRWVVAKRDFLRSLTIEDHQNFNVCIENSDGGYSSEKFNNKNAQVGWQFKDILGLGRGLGVHFFAFKNEETLRMCASPKEGEGRRNGKTGDAEEIQVESRTRQDRSDRVESRAGRASANVSL